jgi:hypothetical protein
LAGYGGDGRELYFLALPRLQLRGIGFASLAPIRTATLHSV